MNGKLKYVLPLIFTFCFLEAAFEINEGDIKNVWEDEYDVYIVSSSSTRLVLKIEHATDFSLLPPITIFPSDRFETDIPATLASSKAIYTCPPELYLINCSLLI